MYYIYATCEIYLGDYLDNSLSYLKEKVYTFLEKILII